MKSIIIFIGGFVTGIFATFMFFLLISGDDRPNDGLPGLSMFPEQGECLTTTSKYTSCEIKVLQVIEPKAALASLKYYEDEKIYGAKTFRNYDAGNEVLVLLMSTDDKTYYDQQKIDISKKCARQIGTYQFMNASYIEKTVPAVIIE